MTQPSDAELIDVVERFVLRGRRVLAHSLFGNEEALEALADGGFYAQQENGEVSIKRALPAEEQLESLAARVRPLTLDEDPVHFDRVLNAVSALLYRKGALEHIDWCKRLKGEWRSASPKHGKARYSVSVIKQNSGEAPQELTDAGLALAWYYGDLVHAKVSEQVAGERFGINMRYAAAAVRTAQLAILTRDTVSFIRFLAEEDEIALDLATLDAVDVRVTSETLGELRVMLGPAGAVAGPAGQALGPEFQEMTGSWLGENDGIRWMRIPWGADED